MGGDEDIFVFEKAEESAEAGAAAFVACGSDGGIRDGFNTAIDEGRHRFFARRSVGAVGVGAGGHFGIGSASSGHK